MRHLFVINPAAGGYKARRRTLRNEIQLIMDAYGEPFEIYMTRRPMDACEKIRRAAEHGEELRVYACGGDGTLNECINGAAGLSNVAVTHFPCGTGNDFIRMFGDEKERFYQLPELLRGQVRPLDLIECNGRYSVNICSIGVDARIGGDVHKYSKIPLIGGAAGYVISAIVHFVKGINSEMTLEWDGKQESGQFALLCVCNGQYYGGGFHPVPEARPDDGVFDGVVVRKVSRLTFARLIGKYAKGKYRDYPELLEPIRGQELRVTSQNVLQVNVDGEMIYGREIRFRMIPGGVNFIFPSEMRFFDFKNEENEVIAR